MVRLAVRSLAILALVLPLAACIFVLSPFPATLSQVVAKADLSAIIPAGSENGYQPFIVTPTGGEFVVLLNRNTAIDPVAIVMDTNLNFIQSYTYSSFSFWGYVGGFVAMTDNGGNAVLGSLRFSAPELSTVGAAPSAGNLGTLSLSGPSFSSPVGGYNVVSFAATGTNLTYQRYLGWGTSMTVLPITIDSSGGSYSVQGVYNVDDTPSAGGVVLVVSDQNNSSYVTFVNLPLYDVLNNMVKSPLLGNYPSKTYNGLAASSVGFAGDSMVGYDQNARTLNRYSLSTFDTIQSLPIGKKDNRLQYAYKASGEYSVVYDPLTRTITKVARWW
jgi:hypothetical protein